MIGELINKIHLDFDFGRGRGEAERVLSFQKDFRELVGGLAGAYHVNPMVYEQAGAEKRGMQNRELNDGKYFFDNLVWNPIKEQGAISEYASGHGAKSYGEGERVTIGKLTVPLETVGRLKPDSAPLRVSEVVITLAKKAAQLKALTHGEEGIPEAYSLARMQTNKALELVNDAATIAYGWKSDSWGRLSLEGVLERASKRMFGKRARTAVLLGALALAGCEEPIVPVGGATPSLEPTATRTEQAMTRSPIENAEIDSAITNLTSLTTPTAEQSLELSELLKVRAGFEQQANALPGWAEVKPENMEFAVVNVYDVQGDVAGGFLMVKNLETSEQMVLSVVERFEADGTAVRKQVNSPLYERFSIDAEGRIINGDWYYIDAEGNQHSLYKTNAVGKLGGVPIEGEIIWSDTTFRIEMGSDVSQLAKLAKLVLPPGDLTGLTIDTELGQMTNSEGMLMSICIEGGKNFVEVPQVLRELSIKLPKESRIEVDLNDVFSIIMKINDEYYIAGDIDLEANQMNIVTAKNEPYKIDLGQLIAKKNDLVILDKDGQQLLEFTDVGWEADKLLFLLAPEPNNGYSYSKDLLPTSMGNREMTSVFINVTEGGSVNVGFYDNLGVLHPYILGLENNSTVVGICETTSANGDQFCRIYTPSEAVEVLKSWYKESMPRLLSFDLLERDSVTEELIAALKAGEGFPIPSDGYKIPVNTIRER